ncbi:hypothetical protein NA56DRAFT_688965 [Hyaloscypha hepaticicola]|uniref:CHAT domain-containing protein n=1 Tax=Hyaloscypha hepaticicola TaxID=2082293 RepID=A0A2J6Q4R8_9HELO|nr:hypothetical protein NA56DRAFT_688965 [Hyaloscypha hepaticicola]
MALISIIISRQASSAQMSFTINDNPEPQTVPSSLLSINNAADLRWYLERYAIKDPFDRIRAKQAAEKLDKCGEELAELVFGHFDPDQLPESDWIRISIRDNERSSSLFSLHWELLEVYRVNKSRFAVIREIESLQPVSAIDTVEIDEDGFRICLVVSRPEAMEEEAEEDSSHRSVSRALLPQFGSSAVHVDIVRPGTWEAVLEYLDKAKKKVRPVHLVHFDVHGVVKRTGRHIVAKLHFMKADGSPVLIDTKVVGQALASHGVQMVILNICDSAKGDGSEKTNLARVLVEQGIRFVFAMSYKLMTSALVTVVSEFYRSLLERKEDVWVTAANVREALLKDYIRRARFGLEVGVNDWIVPITYTAKDYGLRFRWASSKESKSQLLMGIRRATRTEADISPEPVGRDTLILRLESILLLVIPTIQLFGRPASGKTFLANFLCE